MTDAAIAPNRSPDQNHVPGLPLRDLAGFTHRWVDAEGIRLHAVQGGRSSGPTVVLLAGFPQTWWAWHKAMPRLAERFHVIAIDLPGQGHSERPQGGYDTHTLAWRVQAALTALNLPKYSAGFSRCRRRGRCR
jgi:pimeloyl-ACP methyl ester carboxylesterase